MNISVKVKPKSKQQRLVNLGGNVIKAYLRSAPTDNKANDELVCLLAKELKIKKYNLGIIKGIKTRNKVVEVKTRFSNFGQTGLTAGNKKIRIQQ